MVEAVGAREGENLRDLASQTEALLSEGFNEVVRQVSELRIGDFLVDFPVHDLVGECVEELGEVKQQDVPAGPVLPEVSLDMALQSVDCEVVALARHTCAVVINERARHKRDEGVVAEAALHDALVDGHAADVAVFASLIKVELIEAGAPVYAVVQRVV